MNDERSAGRAPAPDHAPFSTSAVQAGWIPPAPPPPAPPAAGAAPGRRSNRAILSAAIAGTLIAGAAIGVGVGLATRGSTTANGNSPNSASASGATARAVYAQALAAMRGSAGFHYVAVSPGGIGAQRIVGDAGQSGGRQVITVDATAGREQFTLVLVSRTVYFEGNTPALEDQLGVPAAGAASLQGKWISVSNHDGPYILVAPGITVADQAAESTLIPTATTPVTTAGSAAATRILGTVPPQQNVPGGTGHLDVAASSHLPIAYVSTVSISGVATTTTVTFSGWGAASTATAPTAAIAWSTLGASPPPGGYGSGGAGVGAPSTPQL